LAKQENQKGAAVAKKPTVAKTRKKTVRNVPSGVAHVKATFNNTIVVITDLTGNVISWASAGKVGFAGSRKSSAFAATVAAQDAAKVAMGVGMREVEVNLSGPGAGRESAVRGLQSSGMMITIIRDKTPVPHNGCRARKRRRV
jgi:small subunit ribosomal protein S11